MNFWRTAPTYQPLLLCTLNSFKELLINKNQNALREDPTFQKFLREVNQRSNQADPLTVVVGGVTWGGAGKSQIVRYIAERAVRNGLTKIYILGHGYRSRSQRGPVQEVREIHRVASIEYGDEAVMLYKSLKCLSDKESPVVLVGGSWHERWRFAKHAGASLIISDGGLYTSSLPRHLSITALPLPIKLSLFPFGHLTRPIHLWARSRQCWIWSIQHHISWPVSSDDQEGFLAPLDTHFKSEVVVSGFIDHCGNLLPSNQIKALAKSFSVSVICAISRPQRVIHILHMLGLNVAQIITCRDHQIFAERYLRKIEQDPNTLWITTEKDEMKFSHHPPNLFVLSVRLNMLL